VSAFVSLEDPSAPIGHEAAVECPRCGLEVIGQWDAGRDTAGQLCPAGHAFEATWPGFPFTPEVVIVGRDPETSPVRQP
jgi:hypothetical protein